MCIYFSDYIARLALLYFSTKVIVLQGVVQGCSSSSTSNEWITQIMPAKQDFGSFLRFLWHKQSITSIAFV